MNDMFLLSIFTRWQRELVFLYLAQPRILSKILFIYVQRETGRAVFRKSVLFNIARQWRARSFLFRIQLVWLGLYTPVILLMGNRYDKWCPNPSKVGVVLLGKSIRWMGSQSIQSRSRLILVILYSSFHFHSHFIFFSWSSFRTHHFIS